MKNIKDFFMVGKRKAYRNSRNDQLTLTISRKKLKQFFPQGKLPNEYYIVVPKKFKLKGGK